MTHSLTNEQRPSVNRLTVVAPLACACAVGVGALLLRGHNPASGSLVPCPLYSATGLYCPGCGLTRAAYALVHGDLGQAFGYNMLFPLFALAMILGWWAWMLKALGRPPLTWLLRLPSWSPVVGGFTLLTFAVLRNVPALGALAP